MDIEHDIAESGPPGGGSEIEAIEKMLALAQESSWAVMLKINNIEIGCCDQKAVIDLLNAELQQRLDFLHSKPNQWE